MKRDYTSGQSSAAVIFTGIEVEHTPAFGLHTLFVVGLHDSAKILHYCETYHIAHVYLGANHSFDGNSIDAWKQLAVSLLDAGKWVTLDFDARYAEAVDQLNLGRHAKFIPIVSVKLPNIMNMNYNACIKIDDRDFNSTNPGVWVHELHGFLDRKYFTDWTKYGQDWIIEPKD